MFKKIFILSILFISSLKAHFYIPQESLKLNPETEKKLSLIEKKLNNIKTLQAHLHQITETAQGKKIEQKGNISLMRFPGKFGFRLHYLPPQEMLIVGMNGNVRYVDHVKGQKGFLNLKSTNAAFLMNETISFKKDFHLISFIEKDKEIEVRVIQKNNPLGYLDLIFKKPTYALEGWRLFEAQGTKIC